LLFKIIHSNYTFLFQKNKDFFPEKYKFYILRQKLLSIWHFFDIIDIYFNNFTGILPIECKKYQYDLPGFEVRE